MNARHNSVHSPKTRLAISKELRKKSCVQQVWSRGQKKSTNTNVQHGSVKHLFRAATPCEHLHTLAVLIGRMEGGRRNAAGGTHSMSGGAFFFCGETIVRATTEATALTWRETRCCCHHAVNRPAEQLLSTRELCRGSIRLSEGLP